jgi:hypothetical protein
VATISDLGALTEAVGGDLVDVAVLARGTQNPHDLEIRPSLMVKMRRADALGMNGLELDGWVEAVVLGAANANVLPGAPGRIDTSHDIPVLEVPTTRVDRSMGDVHPLGNPHYTLDPGLAPIMTRNIVDGLARLAPEHRAAFERNREAFLGRLQAAMVAWTKALEPYRGAKVVSYHADFAYFLSRFGLVPAGAIEDRPGMNRWPEYLPGFRDAVLAYTEAVDALGRRLLPVCAVALALPPAYFDPAFAESQFSFRLSHYPPVGAEENQFGIAPHTDANFLTFLAQTEVPGLQVRMPDGSWLDVPCIPGAFAVNSGDMLQRWTNGRFKSTPHRALAPVGRHRYAIPFFLGPHLDTVIACLPTCQGPDEPARYPPITYGEYLHWWYDANYNAALQDDRSRRRPGVKR